MREKMWFYSIDGKEIGPITIEHLKYLIEAGTINDQTLVWNKSFKKFTKVSEVDDADIRKTLDYIKNKPKDPGTISAMYMGVSIVILLLLIVGIKLSALIPEDALGNGDALAEGESSYEGINSSLKDQDLEDINGLENIELSYGIYDEDEELELAKPEPFENKISFQEMSDDEINTTSITAYEENGRLISATNLGSNLTLSFKNTGSWMPKNPAIIFDFSMIGLFGLDEFMENYNENMETLNYMPGKDYHTKFKWILDEKNILYKEEALMMYNIPFGGSEVWSEPSKMRVSLVDGEGSRVDYIFVIEIDEED